MASSSSSNSLADLSVFVAVADCGSFTAAAEKIGISKSQASKCVGRLERSLGVRLLQRTTRRLRLTEAGSTLHQAGRTALASIEETQAALSAQQHQPRGVLRLSASTSFGATQFPPILKSLAIRHPDLQFDLVLDGDAIDLVSTGIDVAIRIAERMPDSSAIFRRVGSQPRVTCASPAYLDARGVPQSPQDLLAHDCIIHSRVASARRWSFLVPGGKRVDQPVQGRVTVSSILALRTSALAGLGIVQISRSLVADDLRTGKLREVLPAYPVPPLSVFARYPARKLLPPKTRVFIDALADHLSKLDSEPPGPRARLRRPTRGAGASR
jgi:DNA-binding transcriptional LysR family regulator